MQKVVSALVVTGVLFVVGCGGSGGPAVGPGSGGAAGHPGSGGAGGIPANGFHLTGQVQPTQAALGDDDGVNDSTATVADKTVTHVLAVNPSSQNPQRVLAPVAPDGSFSLSLEPGHAWVLVFVDNSRVGADMIAGIFRASTLDTLAPTMPGSGDLGMVDVMPDGTAMAGIAYLDLLAALHLTAADADFLGAADDVCLRYVNPDVDGDGTIDLLQANHDFRLDFHVQFGMRAAAGGGTFTGGNASVSDIVGAFLPEDTGISFGGVGIYASQPATAGAADAATTWAAFEQPISYYPAGMGGLRTALAGEHVAGSDLVFLGSGDYRSEGVYAAAGHDLPQGQYQFGLGPSTLTFTNVRTHSDAELAAATNFIMPFIRLVPTDSACVTTCALAAIDYRWMKRAGGTWIMATAAELALIVGEAGGYISIVKGLDNGTQRIGITIPVDSPAGSFPWSAASAHLENMSEAEMAAMTSADVCHLGLSYDDKLGMRMFSGIANTPGTCGM